MKALRLEPVRWLTIGTAVLVALASVPVFMDALPDRVRGGFLIAVAVLTTVGGVLARAQVTPLADPQDQDGNSLTPGRSNA